MKMRNSDKKSYEIILHDRQYLTDYEKEQLVPELKSRLNILKQYFNEIISLCDVQVGSPVFEQAVELIINPKGLPNSPKNPKISISFFNDVKAQAKKEGVDDIDQIIDKYKDIQNTKQLGLFLSEVNLLCSSLLAVKNHLFLYKIQGYPSVTNIETGKITPGYPQQYSLTTEPFQILITNIVGVAKATSETIDEWHKYAMQLKLQYLNLYTKKLSIKSTNVVLYFQIGTILLAIFLSAFFLVANDPFNLFKNNQELKRKVSILESENAQLKSQKDRDNVTKIKNSNELIQETNTDSEITISNR
jgi:hypothetical protein